LGGQAGVLSWVGYNYRWAPVVQYVRRLIRDGRLGTLTHYRGRFFVDYGSNPDGVLSWRFQRELAGHGTLGDLMSHVADLAHMLAGPVARVVANRKTFIRSRPVATPGEGTHFSVNPDAPRAAAGGDQRRLCRGAGPVRLWRPGPPGSLPGGQGPPLRDGVRAERDQGRPEMELRAGERAATVPARWHPRTRRAGLDPERSPA